ncbi:MAG: hypothetical protein ACLSVD_18270 [Eggerthellaceae bacterium]
MKKKLFGATAATLAIAGALALVGCGGSQDSAAGSAAGKAGDGAAYTLVEDGTFTIGTSAEYGPSNMEDGEYKADSSSPSSSPMTWA